MSDALLAAVALFGPWLIVPSIVPSEVASRHEQLPASATLEL